MSMPITRGWVVFSGGTAANSLVDVFNAIAESKQCSLSYVIPISDNGGSSSELIRVFGGPGIGDVRSSLGGTGRLVRLIPDDSDVTGEKRAIKLFFNHRLPKDESAAKAEWLEIVDARHDLWQHISSEKKELIRSFLNLLNMEIVKRARPSSVFNFSSASIGNLFLTGARIFFGSFESAIYILGIVCGVPNSISVLPAINSNFTHHISAGLQDGAQIIGQNAISHPSVPMAMSLSSPPDLEESEHHDHIEDANWPGSLPTLRKQNISFSKAEEEELPSRIERIWYINPYGQEIWPSVNPKVCQAISTSECVVFSIGSLYTSIIPSIILRGVGAAIASSDIKYKILILNGNLDRETGPSSNPLTALDFVSAIAKAASRSRGLFEPLPQSEYRSYVTHVIHLDGLGSPEVDKADLGGLGIETFRVYGRRVEDSQGLRYDPKALIQAFEAITGRRDPGRDRSRRSSLLH